MTVTRRPWFYYFGNAGLRVIFGLVLRVDRRHLEHVPMDGPLIVAISHSTFLDPLLAGAYLPRDVTPMAKIEAFHLPVLGWIVRSYGAFPVRRGEADLGAFKMALQVLRHGGAMVIAPEGHRSESGALQQGREGAIMMALRSGAPILRWPFGAANRFGTTSNACAARRCSFLSPRPWSCRQERQSRHVSRWRRWPTS